MKLHTFDRVSGNVVAEFIFASWLEAPVSFAYNGVGVRYDDREFIDLDEWAAFVEARQRAETWKPEAVQRGRDNGGHYRAYLTLGDSSLEWIDVRVKQLPPEQARAVLFSHADKYLSRLGKKDDPVKEINKAIWYLLYLREHYAGKDVAAAEIHELMSYLG
jgi:hypothetical protein